MIGKANVFIIITQIIKMNIMNIKKEAEVYEGLQDQIINTKSRKASASAKK